MINRKINRKPTIEEILTVLQYLDEELLVEGSFEDVCEYAQTLKDNENEINLSYNRIDELLNECIDYIIAVVDDDEEIIRVFKHLGFTDKELEFYNI